MNTQTAELIDEATRILKESNDAADTHDYRDYGPHELKRDPGREWERNQQKERIPGVKL